MTTDVGLSPPYNSMFTLFGQFFDHGVDQTVKGGGTVFVPLQGRRPADRGPGPRSSAHARRPDPNLRFMVLTRGQNQPGPDGILGTRRRHPGRAEHRLAWVDQSQTYTSHPSHQVFLREYVDNSAGKPVVHRQAARRPGRSRRPAAWPPGRRPRRRPRHCWASS